MINLSKSGRICYGAAMARIGICTIYYRDFPYMLIPPKHSWIPDLAVVAIISGIALVLAGSCIVFEKKARQVSLVLAAVLILIFCLGFVPYELILTTNYMHLGEWENAEKELALAGGALVMAGCFPAEDDNRLSSFLGKLIPTGAFLFSITIISFGILHFVFAKQASILISSWIPAHMFWMYFCGVALIGSGSAIIFKIRTGLIAALLGSMIFIWFIILHIPRVIASPAADLGDEVDSAFLALAYSGIAFVIAGVNQIRKPQ
jgi:uncharacterized membrane protein YphA (DoxX/SURF4 family)